MPLAGCCASVLGFSGEPDLLRQKPIFIEVDLLNLVRWDEFLASASLAFLVSFDVVVISFYLVGMRLITLPVQVFNYVYHHHRSLPDAAELQRGTRPSTGSIGST
jgi:hypothetical protein